MSRFLLFAFAACFTSIQFSYGATALIPMNSSWKFVKGTSEASTPANAWRDLSFNDASWISSPAPFSYGEGLSGTPLNDMSGVYSCIFIRKKFNVADPSAPQGLRLDVRIDDGFVAWINGTEVFRYNVPAGEPTRTTTATTAIEQEVRSIAITNLTSLLVPGDNVLAVQGFNSALSGSSDFVLDAAIFSFAPDSTPPEVVSATPAPGSTVTALTQISVTFSEPVTGVIGSSLLLNGNTASGVTQQGNTYTFTFPQPPYGPVQVSWFQQHNIADGALFPNRFDETAPGASWQYNLVDAVAPTLASIFPVPGSAVRAVSQVELNFTEDVQGVDAADLLMNGQPATNVNKVANGPYVFQFPAPGPGPVEMTFAPNPGITDFGVPPNSFTPITWSYLLDPNAGRGNLIINEILAANQTGLLDEDGGVEDWIEIYNSGTNTLDLTGWSLSDDPEDPGRWSFASGSISPGGYVIVYASGKDRRSAAGTNRFHTNFQLANGGEFLGLYTPDSPRALASGFSPEFPEQRNDHSYGYDSEGALRYFATPTPGGPNGISTILAVTEPVHFSAERGFYTNAFDLYLSSPTLGSSIRYTLDGVEPTISVGTPYTGPLRITNTTSVRAVAFRTNFLPSVTRTHSYLFNFTAAQRALPVINLVMPLTNWFGRSGILGIAGGSRASDGLYITNNPATDYHNPSQHGIAWERPVSAEYILPQDNSGFQIDCGIRVQGSDWQRPRTTLDSKFSYRLYFRGDYGQGRLNYPVFPLSVARSFDQLVLRAGFNEQINPFIRDEIIRRMSQDMGQVAAVGGLALVLRNGGPYTNNASILPVYNPCERVTSSTMQEKLGGGPDWDVVAPDFAISAEGFGIIDGDRQDFARLMTNVWVGGLRPVTNDAHYAAMSRRLDLPNFVDYCLLNAYTAMGDWPANNWRAARERSTNGIWRFVVWDAEWGMGIYALAVTRDSFAFSGTGTEDAGLNSTGNSEIARLYQGLRANREFRLLWADRIHKHFFNGGALTGLNISNRFNELRAQLEPSFAPPQAMDIEILQWARDRFPIVMGQFNTYGLYGYSNGLYGIFASSNAPVFNQHGGRVASGFSLTMTNPLGGPIYYTTNGDDPRVPFSAAVSNSALTYTDPITLNRTVVVKARSLHNGTNWSALAEAEFKVESLVPTLRITEIMYNPIGGGAYEFIELQNYGATPVNLSGMNFNGIDFTFPDPTVLPPGARIVLSSDANPTGFAQRYPGVTVAGRFGGALNNAGETIALLDRNGNTVLSVSYGNSGLWPVAANGGGYSLVLAEPSGDPDDPLSWRASVAQNGSPGAGDVFPPPPAGVVISEVSAASSPQWIELYNSGPGSVDVASYSLTDDGQSRKYVLPSMTIAAGQYGVIYPSNYFTLSARGDEVLLYNAQTNLLSRVSYGLQPAGYTLAGINNDWALGNPTPGAANVAAALGTTGGLIINEWLANALTGEDDWIELWNNSAQPVSLQGMYVAVSNALFRISSRSFIGPYGFAQLFADEDPGPDHLDFRLPAAGATIAVYDPTGGEVNRLTYSAQAENVSQGRLPDGSATIQTFPGSASPGASNYVFTYTGPYINEVMARNVSAVTNAQIGVADWIEIYNPGGSTVDLGGMRLSVDAPDASQWVFPTGSSVPAGGYLVVWCDADAPVSTTFEDPLNCGRSLDGQSGGVYLFSAAGQLVNFVEYGFQLQNQSIGRVGSNWRLLQTPTLAGANSPAATLGSVTNLTFNEWMADPVRGDDWFELYNAGTQPVDLGGLILTDDPSMGGANKFRVPALSFVGAKGFVRYEADGNPGNGFDHVNFSLDAGGESIRLVNGTTFAPIASVYFGPQAFGVSEGRLPDGAGTIARFLGSETPGESNYQLPGNVLINEVLASANQIELYNPSSEVSNIGGWFLSNTSLDYKLYRIPDGTSVPAGGYRVITPGFTLNTTTGGEVILAVADAAGNLNGQRVHARFGMQDAGVSFGRFQTSQGVEFVALAQPTLGAANASALVGRVVINEIMYNPLPGGIEYVELFNISSEEQSLANWRLANAVDVALPNEILPAGGYLIVEIAPEQGRLDNAGERLDLVRSGGILVDSVDYKDSTPWPSGPVDGEGLSLQRRNSSAYGNEPLNWLASLPTPGEANGSGAVDLPVVDVPPQSYAVPADSVVTLSVAASGGEPLGYQWRFNGVAIPGANGRELPLNLVQLEHSGTYDVLVSNPAGATLSPAATVFVEAAPLIVAPLQSQSISPGASATFTVVARASPPITYQWRFNDTIIPGVNGTTYTVTNAGVPEIGDYSVEVVNSLGSVTSSAYLAVLVPPTFLIQPVTQIVVEGDDATFRVGVTGLPPFGYRWRRPGVSQVTNAIGWDTAAITFTNVPMLYSNNTIDCIVSNPVRPAPSGVQSRQVRLYVLPDTDDDRLPDSWEIANGLNANDPADAAVDTDGDGLSNRQEYLAGTDPRNANSYLRVDIVRVNVNTPAALLSFNAASNKTYSVLYKDELSVLEWSKLLDVYNDVSNRVMQITDPSPNADRRFYRLEAPIRH